MTDQNPEKGAEPIVLSDADAERAALWQEFDETERPDPTPADAGKEDDGFDFDEDAGEDADATTEPATAGKNDGAKEDIWANATPEQREAFQKLEQERKQYEHETRSYEGRAAARLKRIEDLSKQLEQLTKKPEADDGNPLEDIATEYPELHAPIAKALEKVATKAEQAEAAQRGRIEADLKQEQAAFNAEVQAQRTRLDQEQPGWVDLIKANEKAFFDWVNDQPLALRKAAAENFDEIVDAGAAAKVISAFRAHLNPPAQPDPKPNPSDRRQRQLGASSSPGRGSGRQIVSTGIPEDGDPEEIWKAFDKAEDQQRQRM